MASAIQQVVERHLLPEMTTADPVLGSMISQTLNEICRAIPEHPRFWLHFVIDSLLQKTRASAAANHFYVAAEPLAALFALMSPAEKLHWLAPILRHLAKLASLVETRASQLWAVAESVLAIYTVSACDRHTEVTDSLTKTVATMTNEADAKVLDEFLAGFAELLLIESHRSAAGRVAVHHEGLRWLSQLFASSVDACPRWTPAFVTLLCIAHTQRQSATAQVLLTLRPFIGTQLNFNPQLVALMAHALLSGEAQHADDSAVYLMMQLVGQALHRHRSHDGSVLLLLRTVESLSALASAKDYLSSLELASEITKGVSAPPDSNGRLRTEAVVRAGSALDPIVFSTAVVGLPTADADAWACAVWRMHMRALQKSTPALLGSTSSQPVFMLLTGSSDPLEISACPIVHRSTRMVTLCVRVFSRVSFPLLNVRFRVSFCGPLIACDSSTPFCHAFKTLEPRSLRTFEVPSFHPQACGITRLLLVTIESSFRCGCNSLGLILLQSHFACFWPTSPKAVPSN